MRSFWDLLVHAAATSPEWVPVLLLSWSVSVGCTQAAKHWVPLHWSEQDRHRGAQLLAFATAFTPCVALWPTRWGVVAGIAVGLWSPTSWWIVMRIAEHRWPWLTAKLSQDRRYRAPGPQ